MRERDNKKGQPSTPSLSISPWQIYMNTCSGGCSPKSHNSLSFESSSTGNCWKVIVIDVLFEMSKNHDNNWWYTIARAACVRTGQYPFIQFVRCPCRRTCLSFSRRVTSIPFMKPPPAHIHMTKAKFISTAEGSNSIRSSSSKSLPTTHSQIKL